MGIIWSLLSIKDAVVLEYGPAGTTHFSMSLYGEIGIEQENRLFTTHMREDDVVMGDTSRLENAIFEIDENFSPKAIFVVASSCSAVIGTDIKGVCTSLKDRVKAKLITFDQGGFRGDYSAGIRETYKLLAEKLVIPTADEPIGEAHKGAADGTLTYNIIGASIGSYRCKADVYEIKRLMRAAFGMEMKACLCLDTALDNISGMGSADINLVIRSEGLQAAEILEKKCGQKYVYGAPYGYAGTSGWLAKIGETVGKAPAEDILKQLGKKAMNSGMYKMYKRMLKRDVPSAFLYGDYETVLGLGNFLESMGIEFANGISIHNISNIENRDERVKFIPAEKDRIDIIKGLRKTLILADDTTERLADKDNRFMRISMPLIDTAQVAVHMPVMGEYGADMLMEYVSAYFNILK